VRRPVDKIKNRNAHLEAVVSGKVLGQDDLSDANRDGPGCSPYYAGFDNS